MSSVSFTAIDLFCGCGGLSLGFQNAGFNIVAAFDNWDKALNIYRKNFQHPAFNVDLACPDNFKILAEFNPDFILAGPPCQDFSSAGKRNENLGRANLTVRFAEIVSQIKPSWFVMENVKGADKKKKYREARSHLKSAGYGLTEMTLRASLCGVPQDRYRFFCIGHLHDRDEILTPYLQNNLTDTPLSVREYLGDSLDIEHYYRHPRTYSRRAIFSIDEPSPTVRGVNRPIPKNYRSHPGDTAQVCEGVRPLTTIERSWLQTFPKDFIFTGSKTDLEQAIANAVPVKLAEYVAKCILDYLDDRHQNSPPPSPTQLCLPLDRPTNPSEYGFPN